MVDHAPKRITALDTTDSRSFTIEVAGPAALLVAKLHKLGDRDRRAPDACRAQLLQRALRGWSGRPWIPDGRPRRRVARGPCRRCPVRRGARVRPRSSRWALSGLRVLTLRMRPKSGPRAPKRHRLIALRRQTALHAGPFGRALCRTRNGDPFLTIGCSRRALPGDVRDLHGFRGTHRHSGSVSGRPRCLGVAWRGSCRRRPPRGARRAGAGQIIERPGAAASPGSGRLGPGRISCTRGR